MRKIRTALLISTSFLLLQPIFANAMMMSDDDSKPCMMVAKACVHAGYTQHGSADKGFWKDCMKPVIMGMSVKGVSIDADVVKQCRADKIEHMKKELAELEKVS